MCVNVTGGGAPPPTEHGGEMRMRLPETAIGPVQVDDDDDAVRTSVSQDQETVT